MASSALGPTLFQALRIQLRVLHALMLREATLKLGPQKLGHIWVLTETIWGTAFLGFLRYLFSRVPPVGDSIVFYMFSGMFAYTLYRVLHVRVGAALNANKALLSYPVVRPVDTMLARMMLESTFQLIAFLIFYSALIWFGYAPWPAKPIMLIWATGATILLGFGMGVTGMILRSLWATWATLDSMLARILFFISGVFYEVDSIPPQAREVLSWNPLVHAIQWIRVCLYPEYRPETLDVTYLLAFGLITTVFGLGMERLLRPRLLEQ